ncbi:MAG: FtsX-like permease family protein [Chloroflexi bacterium]|nr:FtsX-like permease family protein [Chloroflexota bacterium]
MLRLAIKNLVQNKARLIVSVGGLGLALTLILVFGAVFDGAKSRLTVYIDKAGADVWVAQDGVETMHMSNSFLPATVTDEVKSVPGVQEAVPILYATDIIQANGKETLSYVFGVPDNAPLGKAFAIVEGASMPGPGEVIIDHSIAASSGLKVGDEVTVLGQMMKIVGLTSDTSSLASSVAIVRFDDFTKARGGDNGTISFVLVKVSAGESAAAVASRISEGVSGVTVQTREQFAAQERKLVMDMSGDIINIMNIAGFLTGFAVLALTVYVATIARRKEYGVLKAIGTRNRLLYLVVLVQALLSVALGLVAGVALTLLLSEVVPRFNESMVLTLSSASLLRVAIVSVVIAGLSALLPARQLAGLEPVAIIRRG